MILAEVLTVGDEILFGQITDTNSQWISAELTNLGIKTNRKTSIGDQKLEIINAIDEAFKRSNVVIMTGGLGPTKDDITKKTIAEYFKVDLILNEDILKDVTYFFESRNRTLTEINIGQAYVPSNAFAIRNSCGTAPGMWFETNDGKILISMPGVPFEMKKMMQLDMLPRLKSYFKTPVIFHKMILTIGIGESFLSDMIAEWEDALPSNIKLAYLPSVGTLRLRLTGYGEDLNLVKIAVEKEYLKVYPLISNYVFGYENDNIATVVGKLLVENNLSFGTAESCTGGYISHLITSNPGSSAYFKGSIVSYSNEIKSKVLGVSESDINTFGAVSETIVIQMAEGLRKNLNVDVAVAVSGIAGPEGGTNEKPVGTVWLALSDYEGTITHQLNLGNLRENNIQMSAIAALNMVRKRLLKTNL
jgi:nicotinamide-nucleotide amidase